MTTTCAPRPASPGATSDRAFWHDVLLSGEPSAIPRWTHRPVAGIARYETTIRNDLTAALQRLADELGVSLSSVLLAAHAKVLAALAGERETTTGYVAVPGDQPLPCRLTTRPASWRGMLLEAHRVETELLSRKDFPVHELRRELGLAGTVPDVVLDLTGTRTDQPAATGIPDDGDAGEPATDAVLWVGIGHDGWRRVLRLRYRTDAIDAGYAARIAGYHLTALRLIATDPDAEHDRQSLLSAEELHFQLNGLAGPRRDRPDRRFHELFEEQARTRPDTVAAMHGDQQWTYAELNARANQLGRALLAGGLQREDVVAVVSERTLGWLAAVLAVLKAGGVYLPVEPHFPADRIATMLSRAGCRFVLTEPGSTTALDQALAWLPAASRPPTLDIDLPAGAGRPTGAGSGNLGIPVTADQLAYIYFTSGSTGEPKGAMCEHAGMLNHLYAKIDDLAIGEDQVVAQIAPQCFDISLWQLLCALLVGGRTLLIEQDVILDVERFVDKIIESRVAVLQVVPSYLDVVLSYLEQHPRRLPDLRCVSATGEALRKELVQRWFAVRPGIKLVNAYGLTETSDDTNHEVMDQVPDRERVPLGPCIANVSVYVVDEHLAPVPLGAPGLITFSGVCVGRGYVNDPERTRQAYLSDPHHEHRRLYRSGDYGRWLPAGKLEFLGRRDSQVKISGFRIEIGEIENALRRVPGVRDGAVVVARGRGADQNTRLVAFYAGPHPLGSDALRDLLAGSLPEYMLPTTFHWQESLPLTANGKTDRKTLEERAGELEPATRDHREPSTPTERRLAAVWAKALGVEADQIGRHDHFFDRGGTSLAAVRMTIALDRAVSLRDLTRHPVLTELAALVDGRSQQPSGLLHTLVEPGPRSRSRPGHAAALVCFPYAGGNAVNFQALAAELRGSGLAVHAVELPGHDLILNNPIRDNQATGNEPFASLDLVVEQVVTEITARDLPRVLLWGHSSGAAFALETARVLTARGVSVQRVFLAAQLPGDAAGRQAALSDLSRRSDTEIAATLSRDGGYTELGELGPQRAERIGAAYRHDCLTAHRYLAQALQAPPEVKLSVPVTVVLAADDPRTAGPPDRHRGWESLADQVDLHELTGGGHYFLRSRPAEAARAVLLATGFSRETLRS